MATTAKQLPDHATALPKFKVGQIVRHRASRELGVVGRRVNYSQGTYEISAGIGRTAVVEDVALELVPLYTLVGGGFMFVVKDDNPDVRYTITPPSVTDAEGQAVDPGTLVFEVSSTDDLVVVLTPDPADQLAGSAHFGAPGQASVNVNVKTAAGVLLGAFGAQFTITAGDPAAIVGGSISFEGLTEV